MDQNQTSTTTSSQVSTEKTKQKTRRILYQRASHNFFLQKPTATTITTATSLTATHMTETALRMASTVAPETSEPVPYLSPSRVPITLQPSQKKRSSKSTKVFRAFRSVLRSFPILNPTCRFHNPIPRGSGPFDGHIHGAIRMTGTLFGHRKSHVTLIFQDNPRSIPILLLELAIPTAKFMQDMRSGLLRIILECERKAADKTSLLDEPLWTTFVNGHKVGYAMRRDPTEADLHIMQLLHAVSMGAGVLPGVPTDTVDGEVTYMRAHFDRAVGSRDSETFYMLNPDGNNGPELSIFFIRI